MDIFSDAKADWLRMREGFELMLKRYPNSDYLLNGYAYMACRAEDSERFRGLNARLKNRLSSTAWSERYSPEKCGKKYPSDN